MLLIVGTVRLPPDNIGDARPVMASMIEESRLEDGCLGYSYAVDILDPGLIHVSERWRDQSALDRHFSSPHIARWRAAWQALGIGERQLMVYEVSEPRRT